MPASRQATGVGFPYAIDTSIWRSSVTICSALNLFFGMTQAPFQAHSLTTLGLKKPGQVTTARRSFCLCCLLRCVVAYWHKADNPVAPAFVRFWTKADKGGF